MMTVPEAAEALGITADAVRSRIKRGTVPTVREGGRVFVVLGAADRPTAQAKPADQTGEERLYREMQERIRYLERQVEEERESRRRADTLLAQLMQRIPELEAPAEAPPEARESTETVEAGQELDAERARRERAESTLHDGMDEERWRREEAERERDELSRELYALRQQQRESPQTAAEEPEGAQPRPDAPVPQEGIQRPWWRRVFGG
jgi:hypothetical protein